MADVFVSYARPDEAHAQRVAEALRAAGHCAWRDDELPAHRAYADVIEERLESAEAVVVLWSAESAKSQWVRAEADAARSARKLVQASLDGSIPPIPFNQIQCADLKDWDRSSMAPGWRKLEASVTALAGPTAASGQEATPTVRRRAICVLPFANMSGDAEQEYFSDGISEDITTDLSKVSALAVTARNTAFTFKGQSVDVREIARKLCVSHVLEGSVRKASGRVRITAQLIDGATGDHIWADRYDRDLTDIFAIQDEISKAIVEALKVKLLPEERNAIADRGTSSAEAYNLYLMARQYWITGDFGARHREERVVRICTAATEIDPSYAQAWALMGLAQANLHHGFSQPENVEDGSAAAERALALDSSIAVAYLPRAWRFSEQGQYEAAEAEIAAALRHDPDSWEVNKEAARIFYRQRRMDDVRRHLEKAVRLMETDFHGWGMFFACCNALNDIGGRQKCAEKIIEQAQNVLARDPDNGAALVFGAMSFAALGDLERAREWKARALLLDPENQFMRYNSAVAETLFFNDKDAALDALDVALAKGGRNVYTLAANDPNLDSLRPDPRFQEMLRAAKSRVEPTDGAVRTPAATGEPLRS
jgi:adenylate cyclase